MDPVSSLFGYVFYGFLNGIGYSLVGMGLALIFGIMNIINFSHGAILMLAAYVAYFCISVFLVGPVIGLICAIAVAFIIGGLIDRLLSPLRLRRPELFRQNGMVATLALGIVFSNSVLYFLGGTYNTIVFWPGSIQVIVPVSIDRLLVGVTGILVAVIFFFLLEKTKIGRMIRATAQNRTAAILMGVNVERIYFLVFGLSCMLAGVAGVMMSPVRQIYPSVGDFVVTAGFAVVALGGLGSVRGSLYAGLIIGIIESITSGYISPNYVPLIYFPIVIIVLIIRPKGLFGVR